MRPSATIGTSGFGIGRAQYVQTFSCVEVQQTFYQPPKLFTLGHWRAEAPPDFEFVLKAWQLITHDAKSPTYRRLKKPLSKQEMHEAGWFKRTSIVDEAWETTLACANALKARTILFQCAASFKQTNENIANLETFFRKLNGVRLQSQLNFCWEPRGNWDPKIVKSLCHDLNLWHVVDPFQAECVTPGKRYFRLHGRGGWRHEYDEGELRELAGMLVGVASKRKARSEVPYVFFNNARMTQDALRFRAILEEG